jgi:hypothetical protein
MYIPTPVGGFFLTFNNRKGSYCFFVLNHPLEGVVMENLHGENLQGGTVRSYKLLTKL